MAEPPSNERHVGFGRSGSSHILAGDPRQGLGQGRISDRLAIDRSEEAQAVWRRNNGAVEKTRTSTGVTPQRPQRCASTNSATTARCENAVRLANPNVRSKGRSKRGREKSASPRPRHHSLMEKPGRDAAVAGMGNGTGTTTSTRLGQRAPCGRRPQSRHCPSHGSTLGHRQGRARKLGVHLNAAGHPGESAHRATVLKGPTAVTIHRIVDHSIILLDGAPDPQAQYAVNLPQRRTCILRGLLRVLLGPARPQGRAANSCG